VLSPLDRLKIAISSMYWILQPIFYIFSQGANDQVKEDEMGGACSTNGVEEECI
jgi:hypothetical protein